MLSEYELLLNKKRGYVSKMPDNKKVVVIISGGLDSVILASRLIEDYGLELFPLHIQRHQTNALAEKKSVDYFYSYFSNKYPGKFHLPQIINVNIPPIEIKQDIISYMKQHGHPLRDPILQFVGVQYAVAVSQKIGELVNTVFCAVVPEDYFPHSNLQSIRATNICVCQNMNNWGWVISSPNVDPFLADKVFGKKEEINWAMEHEIPIGKTISCNDASEKTNHLNCGLCSSCQRRANAFREAGYNDPTEYYAKSK